MKNLIKIDSYIDLRKDVTKEEILKDALEKVNQYDSINDAVYKTDMVTKLYYITPNIDSILVVIDDKSKETLGVESNVLIDEKITEYSYTRLPASIVRYKELNIKKNSDVTLDDALNMAQYMADEMFKDDDRHIPIIKIINYKDKTFKIVLPSSFGNSVFSSDVEMVTKGDASIGKEQYADANTKEMNIDEWKKLFGNYMDNINFPIFVSQDFGGKPGVFFRQEAIRVTFKNTSAVVDFKGSVLKATGLNGVNDLYKDYNGFYTRTDFYGTFKNLKVVLEGKNFHFLIANTESGYGNTSKTMIYENCEFDFSGVEHYSQMVYLNGPQVYFRNCKFIMPDNWDWVVSTYRNRGSAQFEGCEFIAGDKSKKPDTFKLLGSYVAKKKI